jgi:hypothetical protein
MSTAPEGFNRRCLSPLTQFLRTAISQFPAVWPALMRRIDDEFTDLVRHAGRVTATH